MKNETLAKIVWGECEKALPVGANRHVVSWHNDGSSPRLTINRGTDTDRVMFYQHPLVGKESHVLALHAHLSPHDPRWWIAAKLMDIHTEMPIDEFEAQVAAEKYAHDIDEARKKGFAEARMKRLTIPEQELCAMIQGAAGKLELNLTDNNLTVSVTGDDNFDVKEFSRLMGVLMADSDHKKEQVSISQQMKQIVREGKPMLGDEIAWIGGSSVSISRIIAVKITMPKTAYDDLFVEYLVSKDSNAWLCEPSMLANPREATDEQLAAFVRRRSSDFR